MLERATSLYDPGACLVCGDKTSSREKVACSPACSSRWNGWQHKVRRAPKMYRECGWCGEAFFRDYRRKGQRYCGRKCGRLAVEWGDAPEGPRAKALAERFAEYVAEREKESRRKEYEQRLAEGFVCEGCGERAEARATTHKWCDACRRKKETAYVRARQARERGGPPRKKAPSPRTGRNCATCGVSFMGKGRAKYCSIPCRPSNRSCRSRRVRGLWVEPVDVRYVMKRDGGKCRICGRRTLSDPTSHDPRAPTLDHIVPLSRGGKHEKRNAQLACRECNTKKHNGSVGSQLLLIG